MGTAAFRKAVEARDLDGMMAQLSDDVRLHSPVKFRPFEGQAEVRQLFSALLRAFRDFRYTDELTGDGTHVLLFSARVGDREIQGMDLLRFGPEGLVADLTVMIRPLSAVIAVAEAVGSLMAHTDPADDSREDVTA